MLVTVSPVAYEGDIHQELTFIAARQYNQCAEDTHLATLTPLEVRYIAIANANQADAAWWRRMFRWNYYNRGNQTPGKFLWIVDTRMHNHYRNTLRRLEEARDLSRRFTNLGRVINYVQDATTPVHVVPVYTGRWWRLSASDRFNGFAVDADGVAAALGDDCSAIRSTDVGFDNLLASTAERTINSVTESIPGLPVSWEAFWELNDDPEDFGRYGNAGNNFGREVRFRCGPEDDRRKNCVLVHNDPLYREYAQARHLDAVQATIAAMAIMQERVQLTGMSGAIGPVSAIPDAAFRRSPSRPAGSDSVPARLVQDLPARPGRSPRTLVLR